MNPENPQLHSPSKTADFIQSVLQLKPRLAVFDCDGTLWAGDAGFGFFEWELTRGLVSDDVVRWARARYADYLAGKVSEDDMCAEMVTINRGLAEADVMRAAEEFFEEKMVGGFFPEMKDLVLRAARYRLRGLGGLFHQRMGHPGRHEAFRNSAGPDSGGGGCGRGRQGDGQGHPRAQRQRVSRRRSAK